MRDFQIETPTYSRIIRLLGLLAERFRFNFKAHRPRLADTGERNRLLAAADGENRTIEGKRDGFPIGSGLATWDKFQYPLLR